VVQKLNQRPGFERFTVHTVAAYEFVKIEFPSVAVRISSSPAPDVDWGHLLRFTVTSEDGSFYLLPAEPSADDFVDPWVQDTYLRARRAQVYYLLDRADSPLLPSCPRFVAFDPIECLEASVQSKDSLLARLPPGPLAAWLKSRPEPTVACRIEMLDDDRRWTLWYHDLFDRESEPSLQKRGVGTVEGLTELWGRFLHEGVDDFGQTTPTDFSLRLENPPAVITIDRASEWRGGAAALKKLARPGERRVLAEAHAALGDKGSTELLRLAAGPDLLPRLAEIAARRHSDR
jgi:hypothetical protein